MNGSLICLHLHSTVLTSNPLLTITFFTFLTIWPGVFLDIPTRLKLMFSPCYALRNTPTSARLSLSYVLVRTCSYMTITDQSEIQSTRGKP